ncbi:MAG: RNA polymerase sigma factor [Thiotrichaceae bacterium]|nr:RNA polymerase sigma factor [Thiotrichaceae bacterium]
MVNSTLNQFFLLQEKRALVMARIALNNDDAALDVVQNAMLKHYTHYADRPENEWAKLFQRILQNCINDQFRKRTLRQRFFTLFNSKEEQDEILESKHVIDESQQPLSQLNEHEFSAHLERELRKLTGRQRQSFLLRAWEGYSNEECARLMGCSVGSVKSHYFRAQHKLQQGMKYQSKEEAQ